MNIFQFSLVILILSWVASFFLPWLALPLIAFFCGLLWQAKGTTAFWGAFIAVFFMILIQLLFISFPDQFRTANNIGAVMGKMPGWSMILITPILFGFTSGMSALSGAWIRKYFLLPKSGQ